MSLIIKGLDMPNKGYLTEITDVTIRQFADGKIQIEIPKTSMPYYRLYEAIQIPKGHGDIKDVDELKSIKSIQSADFNSIETIQKWIDNAPTFLKEEE